jgi:TM2 domain-containing membrane protein YozV
MKQKVWVINDLEGDVAPAKTRMDFPSPKKNRMENRLLPQYDQKSPALTFSFSLLVWGSGHMYIREYVPALIFMASMVFFYSVILASLFFWDSVILFVSGSNLSAAMFMAGAVVFLFAGLVLWLFNAVRAYYRAERMKWSGLFQGVDNAFWPLLCSLLFPGWGQFLNGQPKKGLFFLLFGMMGILSVIFLSAAQSLWTVLFTHTDRFVFELCFTAALAVVPAFFLAWIVSAHDAFWSCREPVRKRSILKRFQYFRDRARTHGIMRALLPKIRATVILGLLFTVSILVGRHYFPKEYYLHTLETIRIEMLNSNMEITPELVRKAIVFIDR